MSGTNQLVVFTLDDKQYSLSLTDVERVVRAVEITHLPAAPDFILGVINLEGRVIPVVDTRKRLGLPAREIELEDRFIIVNHLGNTFALVADQVKPVMEVSEQEIVSSDELMQGTGFVGSVVKLEEGMIMTLKMDRTLPFDEYGRLSIGTTRPDEGNHAR
ncbi:MAG: chemotaxis protein CheW [Pseudomonadota bacterium]